MKPIIFVKLGGSLITDKKKEFTVYPSAIKKMVSEIKKCREKGKVLLVAHGSGSFGHMVAEKYQTIDGYKDRQSLLGAALTEKAAVEINRIVRHEFLIQKIPAVSLSPLSIFSNCLGKPQEIFLDSLEQLFESGFLPLIYGDVVLDKKTGFTIFSADKILKYLALALKKKNWQVKKIIHCGITNGVYDKNRQTIPVISRENFLQIKASLQGSAGVDVTGGMIHKVQESLELAEKGIPTLIINGNIQGNLSEAILDNSVKGTKITNHAGIVR